MAAAAQVVAEPFPIFKLAYRYLLYDINTVTHVRAEHKITGVLIGGLPQAPQQNVFLGIPLELMPEEARLLIEKGVAYMVDDVKVHKTGFMSGGMSVEERRAYQASLRKQGRAAAGQAGKRTEDRKKAALSKKLGTDNWNDIPEDMLAPNPNRKKVAKGVSATDLPAAESGQRLTAADNDEELLFASPMNSFPPAQSVVRSRGASNASTPGLEPYAVTPAASYPPLRIRLPSSGESQEVPDVPDSYPLFKHLHNKDYFLAPGLRFGCQYMAYPGDPLRFHSHFLCNGMKWDQEFALADLVGGGRLGTGVKKGFLIGGEQPASGNNTESDHDGTGGVRAFCIEWGGM